MWKTALKVRHLGHTILPKSRTAATSSTLLPTQLFHRIGIKTFASNKMPLKVPRNMALLIDGGSMADAGTVEAIINDIEPCGEIVMRKA
jgi:hypothetical protein